MNRTHNLKIRESLKDAVFKGKIFETKGGSTEDFRKKENQNETVR